MKENFVKKIKMLCARDKDELVRRLDEAEALLKEELSKKG
jgi:hypothetical protein